MTPAEIVKMVQGDPSLAIYFIIDNNPEALVQNLNSLQLLDNPDPTRGDLYQIVTSIKDEKTFLEVMQVPYNENQNNYTANLEDYFPSTIQKSGGAPSPALAIIGGILTATSSVFNWLGSKEATEQTEIAQQMQSEQLEFLREQDAKNRVFGIPLNTVVIFAGIFAVVIVVAIIFNRK